MKWSVATALLLLANGSSALRVTMSSSYIDNIAPLGSTGAYKSAKPLKNASTGGNAYVQSLNSGAAPVNFGSSSQPTKAAPSSYMDALSGPNTLDFSQFTAAPAAPAAPAAAYTPSYAAAPAAPAAGAGPTSYLDAIAPAGTTGNYKSARPLKATAKTTGYMSHLQSAVAAAPAASYAAPAASYAAPAAPAAAYTPSYAAAPAAPAAGSGPASYLDAIAPAGTTGSYKSARPLKATAKTTGYMSHLQSGAATEPVSFAPAAPAAAYTPSYAAAPAAPAAPAAAYTPSYAAAPAAPAAAAAGTGSYLDAIAPAGTTGQYKSAKPLKNDALKTGYMAHLNSGPADSTPSYAAAPAAQAAPSFGNYMDSLSR